MVVPNPAFAGLDNNEAAQALMSNALDKAYRAGGIKPADRAGDGNAGLPTNFVDLAHRKLRPGGVLAVIVPVAMVTGKSWEKTRQLLAKHYEDIEIVTMASMESSTSRAFSNDTNMAEAIIVATKRHSSFDPDKGRAPVHMPAEPTGDQHRRRRHRTRSSARRGLRRPRRITRRVRGAGGCSHPRAAGIPPASQAPSCAASPRAWPSGICVFPASQVWPPSRRSSCGTSVCGGRCIATSTRAAGAVPTR